MANTWRWDLSKAPKSVLLLGGSWIKGRQAFSFVIKAEDGIWTDNFGTPVSPPEFYQEIDPLPPSVILPEGWNPIETAPKDRPVALLVSERSYAANHEEVHTYFASIGNWDKECEVWVYRNRGAIVGFPDKKIVGWSELPPVPGVE